jgi:hypothetical protein
MCCYMYQNFVFLHTKTMREREKNKKIKEKSKKQYCNVIMKDKKEGIVKSILIEKQKVILFSIFKKKIKNKKSLSRCCECS